MKKQLFPMLGATLLATGIAYASGSVHWGYEGHEGPENWGSLSKDFAICSSGKNQSPINLTKTIEAKLSPIKIDYKAVPLSIINNGHTIQVNYAAGSSISLDGHTFDLLQFHFHTPSENHIDGKSFPMEGHLVHRDAEGNLGVIAVMFNEGTKNPFIDTIWQHMPKKAGSTNTVSDVSINVNDMLPVNRDYYRFNGSLTTPPCSEGVVWMVLKNASQVSKQQVNEFHTLMGHDNNRPIQPCYARPVLK